MAGVAAKAGDAPGFGGQVLRRPALTRRKLRRHGLGGRQLACPKFARGADRQWKVAADCGTPLHWLRGSIVILVTGATGFVDRALCTETGGTRHAVSRDLAAAKA